MTTTTKTLDNNSYGEILAHEQHIAPATKKGERKREALLAAAAITLNNVNFHQLRVSDICRQADTSTASFYIYFKNKKEITLEVLKKFSEKLFGVAGHHPKSSSPRSDYQSIYDANLAWLHIVRHNIGLMRCLLQISYEDDEFTNYYRELNFQYNQLAADKIIRRLNNPSIDQNTITLKVFALSAMTDECTRRLIEGDKSNIGKIVQKSYKTDEELAHFLSELWYNAIFK
jgi:AcrR family transcriptional regulator